MLICRDCGRVIVIVYGDLMNCILFWGKLIWGILVGICWNLMKSGNGGIMWVLDDVWGERVWVYCFLWLVDLIFIRLG